MLAVAAHQIIDQESREVSTIPVELPDHLNLFVDQSAERAGFANASEYIVALVTAASEKQGEIDQALMAGIASGPAEPWTDDEWQAIKSRVAISGTRRANDQGPGVVSCERRTIPKPRSGIGRDANEIGAGLSEPRGVLY
jgi:Arc/MetJ-type ribon-helix-helix transcriptional regulator